MPKLDSAEAEKIRTRYRMSGKRVVWTTINRREFIVFRDADFGHPDVDNVWIEFKAAARRVSLTSMTAQELAAFRDLVNEAIEIAMPIAEELDRRALADYEEGNDVNVRLYRSPAQLFRHGSPNLLEPPDGERSERRDDPGVSRGSPGLP